MSEINSISKLKKLNFSLLPFKDKIAIKNSGRPKPMLVIIKESKFNNRVVTRCFNEEVYDKNDWVCGCDKTNKLYCFPCILFDGSPNNWSVFGVDDLSHLPARMKSHEKTQAHINSQLSFKLLGKQNICQQLSNEFRLSIDKYNEQVFQNRYVLYKIINCIKFCGTFELALCGQNEKSVNPEVFRGLLNFSAELDTALKINLENTTAFKWTSKIIQNDILDCILTVCQNQIKNEINQAEFLSIIVDEATDLSISSQMSIVFRYVLIDGSPVERFWSFFTSAGDDAKLLFECIKSALQKVLSENQKLITQSYGSVMSKHIAEIQSLIKSEYPNANYVHCYANQLHLITKVATYKNKETRIFFSNLTDIANFFTEPQRVSVFDEIVKKRFPETVETKWNFNNRVVNTVHENREMLIECIENIESTANKTNTINQAGALRRMLKEPIFIYWLNVFQCLMPHIDILYNQLQRNTDSHAINNAINNFEINIKKEIDNLDNIKVEEDFISVKRKKLNFYLTGTIVANEICDLIIVIINDLFKYKKHHFASNLFLSVNFENYEKAFPENDLEETTAAYPFLDKSKLKTELQVIYKRNDFKNISGAVSLLKFIISNQLQSTFSETSKLLKILITIPMNTTEPERSFSTMNRIKTFLCNTISEDQLSALSMLSIEKQLINNISNFNANVLNVFCKNKEKHLELVYQNITD